MRWWGPGALGTLTLLVASVMACEPEPAAAGPVLYGAIWTGDSTHPEARALAVRGDTIVAIGDSGQIAPLIGPDTHVIDAGTGLVLPGFEDGHTHFSDGGAQLSYVDLRDADTPGAFTRRIKAYAAKLKPGEWTLGGT